MVVKGWDQSREDAGHTTAAAFTRYLSGEVLADSASLQWTALYFRLCRFPRVVDRFLVPATAEPHISCTSRGSAEFLERDPNGAWITRHICRGTLFVTRSRTPYEVQFQSPAGQEIEVIQIHVAVEPFGPPAPLSVLSVMARFVGTFGRERTNVDYAASELASS
jgi:hypothetical protein